MGAVAVVLSESVASTVSGVGDREINEKWAAWLRSRMRARSIDSPTALAKASGVDQSVISRWLNEGRTPQVDQLRKIADPLKATMIDLLIAADYVRREEVTGEPAPDLLDVPDAIERDTALIDEARAHLLNQYELLRRLSEKAATQEAARPLRAVARKRSPRKP